MRFHAIETHQPIHAGIEDGDPVIRSMKRYQPAPQLQNADMHVRRLMVLAEREDDICEDTAAWLRELAFGIKEAFRI